MSDKERIAELEELNRRLSNMLVSSADRLQESVRQIKAEAWGEGYWQGCDDELQSRDYDGGITKPNRANPYREASHEQS